MEEEIKGLEKYNRPQLIKIVAELLKKNKILNEAIDTAVQQIEELKADLGRDRDEYDWELKQQKEREHIS